VSGPKRQPRRSKPSSGSRTAASAGIPAVSWIRALAAPYLRDYQPSLVSRGSLRGYRFIPSSRDKAGSQAGFFVGYIVDSAEHEFLNPAPPECIVSAFLGPVGSGFHEEMVARDGSPLRKTAEYIGWLTHRPPRFAFFDSREMVLTRHFSMREWPAAKRKHYSSNFFIETLAWLVRSGLVAKLRGEAFTTQLTAAASSSKST